MANPAMDRDAGYDIDQHWIKLGPLQSYEITKESHSIGLMASGRWTVEAGYVPMQANAIAVPGCPEGAGLLQRSRTPFVKSDNLGKTLTE
jgi:hypothetical protein